jgi:hypothetical protein
MLKSGGEHVCQHLEGDIHCKTPNELDFFVRIIHFSESKHCKWKLNSQSPAADQAWRLVSALYLRSSSTSYPAITLPPLKDQLSSLFEPCDLLMTN